MARRQYNGSLLDDLALLPWWLTLIAGAGIWLWRRHHPMPAKTMDAHAIAVTLGLMFLQLACFGAALVSGIATIRRKLAFASAKDIESIRAMSWREFETLIAETYRRQGFTVEETGGGGADGGIDLILRGKGQKAIVQCKQWRTYRVGVKVVREMYGVMVAEKADRVVIVTSGTYTQEAQGFAKGKPILLIDGKALAQHIREVKGEPAVAPAAATAPAAKPVPQQVLSVQTQAAPACPKCGSAMVLRTAKKGANAGGQFWGCSRYPECRGIINVT
ncbi:MAG: restriction endonuclease [Lentisphaerae bacterium]|jgi:restriction system protein|nr:restriction endonuclease [Lentisphaerota bacterium]